MATASANSTVKNRRQFVRIPAQFRLFAQKILFEAKVDTGVWGEVKNIGIGGLLFVARGEFHENDKLKVTLAPPDPGKDHPVNESPTPHESTGSITAVCQVKRAHKLADEEFEIGAKFVNVFRDDLSALKQLVRRKGRDF